jgi:ABC-type dipeptide/oligopeptide/nickel transport system ATPase component
MPNLDAPLLELRNVSVSFPKADGYVRPVDGVTFQIGVGETVALVGESGSGKSRYKPRYHEIAS